MIFRLFNTVSRRQVGQYGMVIPRIVQQTLLKEPFTVFGAGSRTRCSCHLFDVSEAILGLVSAPEADGQVFNVGGRDEISIYDLALRITKIVGSSSEILFILYVHVYEDGLRTCNAADQRSQK